MFCNHLGLRILGTGKCTGAWIISCKNLHIMKTKFPVPPRCIMDYRSVLLKHRRLSEASEHHCHLWVRNWGSFIIWSSVHPSIWTLHKCCKDKLEKAESGSSLVFHCAYESGLLLVYSRLSDSLKYSCAAS